MFCHCFAQPHHLQEWEPVAEVPIPPPAATTSSSNSLTIMNAEVKWRGDGKFFSTSCCYQGLGGQRQLLIWERDGAQLHATCQGPEAEGLTGPTCWPPNSRHLYAATQAAAAAGQTGAVGRGAAGTAAGGGEGRLQQQQQQQQQQGEVHRGDGGKSTEIAVQQRVQLFERNGLPHGHFDLPGSALVTTNTGSSSSGSSVSMTGVSSATHMTHVCQFTRNKLAGAASSPPAATAGAAAGSLNGRGTDDMVIHQMQFSPDSEVLAVVLAPRGWQHHRHQQQQELLAVSLDPSPADAGEGLDGALTPDESGPWEVQLWHRSNWHWYLKQVLVWEAPGPGGIHGAWEEGGGQLLLHLMGSWGEYCRVGWGWECSVSGRGTAAVVDGCQVLLTPLR